MKGHSTRLLCWLVFFSLAFGAQAQLHFKLQFLPDENSWAVFVKPDNSITPSGMSATGSGQISIVAPRGFSFKNLKSYGGTWANNSKIEGPSENPDKSYIFFGFSGDNPPIVLGENKETLLFTIEKVNDCPDTLYLFDNENDPFGVMPNSHLVNPGNDLTVFDLINREVYKYEGNYGPNLWNCDPDLQTSAADEISPASDTYTYPNPARETLHLFTSKGRADITLKSMDGRTLYHQLNYQSEEPIDLRGIPAGIYSLWIEAKGQVLFRKVVIQK